MNQKENVLEIIRFGSPERVVSHLPQYWLAYHGVNHEGYDGGGHDLPVGSVWKDIWLTEWHKEHAGVMGFPRGNPLADIGALKGYQWPDPDDKRICRKIFDAYSCFSGGDVLLSGSHRDTLWEKSYMLVGMENMMGYFNTDPEYAREILHRIMDFQIGIARHYLSLGVEMVALSDDLGTQNSLLLSPAIIRDFLVPEYKRLFDLYRKHQKIVMFHSCGHIEPVLDVFMELGVNILDPVQASANNLKAVREKTMNKMALHGGVSTKTLMDGPVGQIRADVRDAIRILGKDGGYFCAPDQGMPWPESHYQAFEEAVYEYGKYPLDNQ